MQLLQQGKLEEAQKAKEEIEEKQRKDVKLREKYGPKKWYFDIRFLTIFGLFLAREKIIFIALTGINLECFIKSLKI